MADSTITQLPLSPHILDKDLMVVVTGHLEDGAFPRNQKIPLAYIRKYIVRLNLLTSPQSGIGTYYNSGVNILTLQHIPRTGNLMRYDYDDEPPYHQTISTTGLNSIAGNLVDISFAANSDAVLTMNSRSGSWSNDFVNSNFIENFGNPYHSGVISITGVNARTENNIVKEYEAAWPYTGVYYNSGLNIIIGNNIDIAFFKTDPAANAMSGRTGSWPDGFSKDNLEAKYWSGIISTTGLNAYPENLIKIDYNNNWPHSGIIYNTGLNARAGNNIEINFSSTGNAHNQYGGAGGKYSSGIISVTGSNISDGNGIGYNIETSWPYKFNIFNTEKIKYATSSTTIYNNDTYPNSTTAKYNILTLNYNDFYFSKTNQTLSLVGTAVFKISSIAFGGRPYVPGQGSLNTQKLQELLPLSGVTYGYSYITCDSTVCPGSETGAYAQNTNYTTVTWNDTHLANFVSDAEYDYIINSFTLNVGISGANNSNLISNISSYPITFKNSTLGASRPYYGDSYCTETYRNGNYPYSINATDPMTIMAKVDMSINSSGINNYNSLALCAFITNVRCSRVYTNSVDLQPNIYCSVPLTDACAGYYFNVGSTVPNTYSYISTSCYANTTAVIDAKFIKGENIVS